MLRTPYLQLLFSGVLLTTVGCQTGYYQAASLPKELLASPAVEQRGLKLASLAGAATPSTTIGPGDLLDITVLSGMETEPAEPLAVRVAENGVVNVPVVGPVRVAGVEPIGAEQLIAQAAVARGIYRQPNVHLEVRTRATNRVTVLGAVDTPGVHEVPVAGCTVVAALAAAGGLTEEAGTEVEIIRQHRGNLIADGNLTSPPDIAPNVSADEVQLVGFQPPPATPLANTTSERIDLAQRQTLRGGHTIGDGDVVMVLPKETRAVYVSGLVKNPDQFELPEDKDLRMLDALALAGGRSSPVADRVLIIRQRQNASPAVIQASIRSAKRYGRENLTLAPGDLISVESSVATSALDAVKNLVRVTLGVSGTGISL